MNATTAAWIDRNRPAQRHEPNRERRRNPDSLEILTRLHSDQEEDQGVCNEGGVSHDACTACLARSEIEQNDFTFPMISPAVIVANTPDKPKWSAIRNEP